MGLVRTNVSEECLASIIRVTRMDELRMLPVTSNGSSMLIIFLTTLKSA
jgi:hypothetical protein